MSKKKVKQQKATAGRIPAGFTQANTGKFAPNWDFQKRPELLGSVMSKKSVTQGTGKDKRDVPVLVVADEHGEMLTVWGSKALEELMEKAKPTDQVYIHFDGFVKLKGRKQPMKAFTTAIKAGTAKKGR